jgi:hypothetical protein
MRRTITAALTTAAVLAAGAAGGLVATTGSGPAGAATSTPAGVVVVSPSRVLDTRNTGKLAVNGQVVVSTGVSGAVAVAVNITLTDTDGAGFVTAWDGTSSRPTASIINSDRAGETIANYTIVPVDPQGSFTLFTSSGANLIVDFMGYLPGSTPLLANNVTAVITGYAPGSSYTSVTGTASNGTAASRSVRVDLKCPNGTVETDLVFSLAAGSTKGWSVLCTGGAFTAGAVVQAVVDV